MALTMQHAGPFSGASRASPVRWSRSCTISGGVGICTCRCWQSGRWLTSGCSFRLCRPSRRGGGQL